MEGGSDTSLENERKCGSCINSFNDTVRYCEKCREWYCKTCFHNNGLIDIDGGHICERCLRTCVLHMISLSHSNYFSRGFTEQNAKLLTQMVRAEMASRRILALTARYDVLRTRYRKLKRASRLRRSAGCAVRNLRFLHSARRHAISKN